MFMSLMLVDSKTIDEFSHPFTQWYFVKNAKLMALNNDF